jgi:predicted O-methyltransferase YrrM
MNDLIKKIIDKIVLKIKKDRFISLFNRPFFRIRKLFYVLYLILILKRLKKNYASEESLIDFVFSYGDGLLNPKQVKSEILNLIQILKKEKPKFILEIGTANGGTLFLFTKTAAKDAIIISIDLPGGIYGGGYPEWKIPLYKSFSLPKQRMILIRESSHKETTLDIVKLILNDKKLDYLFIDGDHTYEGVKNDFEMYSPLVKENALIAFHDIVIHPPELNVGVHDFWNEIKQYYDYKEIVEDWDQKRCGIGLIKNISKN